MSTDVVKLVKSLQKTTKAKVQRKVDLLKEFAYEIGMPHSKKIGENLFELRVRGQQEIRIFYTYKKNRIILFHSFIKKLKRHLGRN